MNTELDHYCVYKPGKPKRPELGGGMWDLWATVAAFLCAAGTAAWVWSVDGDRGILWLLVGLAVFFAVAAARLRYTQPKAIITVMLCANPHSAVHAWTGGGKQHEHYYVEMQRSDGTWERYTLAGHQRCSWSTEARALDAAHNLGRLLQRTMRVSPQTCHDRH